MRIFLISLWFVSTQSHALVGLPPDTCKAMQDEASNMREQAKTGEPAGDTQLSAGLECGGNIPWDQGAEALTRYWNRCADIYDQAYRDNCLVP